jgi:hypothetical protein
MRELVHELRESPGEGEPMQNIPGGFGDNAGDRVGTLERLSRLAGCSSHRKRPLGIWRPRALSGLILDYGLDGAWRIICYNIYPIHRMRLNIGNTWSLPRCSMSPIAPMHTNFLDVNAVTTDRPALVCSFPP